MKYYYLLATLPDLSLDIETSNIDFSEIVNTIKRNLSEEDRKTFKYLIYPNDNRNLLNAIFKAHHGLIPLSYQKPSVFDEATIEDYVQERFSFPDYITDFLTTFQERFPEMGMDEIENHLMEGFFQEVAQLQDPFIGDYYSFERTLRSIVSAFNRSLYNFLDTGSGLEDPEVTDRLANEGSGMAILAQAYPFIASLREAIHSKDPLVIEQAIDRIKWEFIGNYSREFFSSRHVYGYTFKLFILQRRAAIDRADAEEQFTRLNDQIGALKQLT